MFDLCRSVSRSMAVIIVGPLQGMLCKMLSVAVFGLVSAQLPYGCKTDNR